MTTTIWILGDQLLARHPALQIATERYGQEGLQIIMVESRRRAQKLPYHRKKLILLFSAMRHYAAFLQEAGYQVDYRRSDTFADGLQQHIVSRRPTRLLTMAASDYPGRMFQQKILPSIFSLPVEVLPNEQFLVESYDPIPDPERDKRYVMEHFYRKMRSHLNVLVNENGQPAGGQWNFDHLNRQKLPKGLELQDRATFDPDEITRQVIDEVAALPEGTGQTERFNYAVTRDQAMTALKDFIERRLTDFGPYEDAMTSRHDTLFHSVLSPYLNIGLLEPMQLVNAAVKAYEDDKAPINSVEGFVRQIIGWREFMYWQYWRLMPALSAMNFWEAKRSLPALFWNGETEMNCLGHVVRRVLDTGYSHHIERLMIISNFCLLAGIRPQIVLEWFKSCYIDAYEWVMDSNVLGMGLNADGGLTATKPYIASANYIHRMSDYCGTCHYDRRQRTGESACPFNYLYWNFVLENEEVLRANPRSGRGVLGLSHFDASEKKAISQQAKSFLEELE
jgi:deoxyribodipyrimidine photolyase-related protein